MITGLSFIDFTLIFLLVFVTCTGFFFGLIRVIGSIATILISILMAGVFFNQLSSKLQPYLLDNSNLSKVIAFIMIYWFCSLLLSFIVEITNKIFHLPILKTVNRLLGGLVALVASIIILSIFFQLFYQYAWGENLINFFRQSILIGYFIMVGQYLTWVIPGL